MIHRNGYVVTNRILSCVATMSSKKDHELMDNLNSCLSLVQQSSAKGISAQELSKKLGKHRTTVHGYLSSLELMGKVESQQGLWYPKTQELSTKSTEKEIIIKHPLPKNEWQRMVLLKHTANMMSRDNNAFQISIDMLEETRTTRIICKNVDEFELKKISDAVKKATEKSYKSWFKNPFKQPKKSEVKETEQR